MIQHLANHGCGVVLVVRDETRDAFDRRGLRLRLRRRRGERRRVGEDAPGEREPRRLVRHPQLVAPQQSVERRVAQLVESGGELSTSLGAHVPPARGSDAFAVFAVVARLGESLVRHERLLANVRDDEVRAVAAQVLEVEERGGGEDARGGFGVQRRELVVQEGEGRLDRATVDVRVVERQRESRGRGVRPGAAHERSEVGRAREHEAVQGVRLPERRHRHVAEFLLVPSQRLDVRGEAGRGGRGRGGAPRDGIIVGRRASAGGCRRRAVRGRGTPRARRRTDRVVATCDGRVRSHRHTERRVPLPRVRQSDSAITTTNRVASCRVKFRHHAARARRRRGLDGFMSSTTHTIAGGRSHSLTSIRTATATRWSFPHPSSPPPSLPVPPSPSPPPFASQPPP